MESAEQAEDQPEQQLDDQAESQTDYQAAGQETQATPTADPMNAATPAGAPGEVEVLAADPIDVEASADDPMDVAELAGELNQLSQLLDPAALAQIEDPDLQAQLAEAAALLTQLTGVPWQELPADMWGEILARLPADDRVHLGRTTQALRQLAGEVPPLQVAGLSGGQYPLYIVATQDRLARLMAQAEAGGWTELHIQPAQANTLTLDRDLPGGDKRLVLHGPEPVAEVTGTTFVFAVGNAAITAVTGGTVRASGNTTVSGVSDGEIWVSDTATVSGISGGEVWADKNTTVTGVSDGEVHASGTAKVTVVSGGEVEAEEDATVTGVSDGQVYAFGTATVSAVSGGHIRAWDTATVHASGGSIETWGQVRIYASDSVTITGPDGEGDPVPATVTITGPAGDDDPVPDTVIVNR